MNFVPTNKHLWIEEIKTDEKVAGGLLFAPGNVTNQYKLAKVLAVCVEVEHIAVGDVVLYDSLGSVNHRMGNSTITTVKALNVLGKVGPV